MGLAHPMYSWVVSLSFIFPVWSPLTTLGLLDPDAIRISREREYFIVFILLLYYVIFLLCFPFALPGKGTANVKSAKWSTLLGAEEEDFPTAVGVLPFSNWSCSRSVSYTHLDVYKRQIKHRPSCMVQKLWTHNSWHSNSLHRSSPVNILESTRQNRKAPNFIKQLTIKYNFPYERWFKIEF